MKNMTINTTVKTFNQMVNDNAMILAGKKLALVSVNEMFVDGTYQRTVQKKAHKIANEWEDNKCDILQISYRVDLDKYAIIDGQNRWSAACKIGVTHLLCQIFEGLTIEEEARMFAEQNDNVTKISAADKFKSMVVMGDEVCLQIKQLCDEFGISIRRTQGDSLHKIRKNLNGITGSQRIVKAHGIDCLRWIFEIISESGWELTAKAYSHDNLQVLLTFYQACVNKDSFKENTERLINLYANIGEYNALVNHANKYVLDRNPRNDKKSYTEREAVICYIEHMLFNK